MNDDNNYDNVLWLELIFFFKLLFLLLIENRSYQFYFFPFNKKEKEKPHKIFDNFVCRKSNKTC